MKKTALLIKFQRISMEVNAKSPHKNEELNKALAEWSGNLENHLIGASSSNKDGNNQSFVNSNDNNEIIGDNNRIEIDTSSGAPGALAIEVGKCGIDLSFKYVICMVLVRIMI